MSLANISPELSSRPKYARFRTLSNMEPLTSNSPKNRKKYTLDCDN
jgi:hypothetical protein